MFFAFINTSFTNAWAIMNQGGVGLFSTAAAQAVLAGTLAVSGWQAADVVIGWSSGRRSGRNCNVVVVPVVVVVVVVVVVIL